MHLVESINQPPSHTPVEASGCSLLQQRHATLCVLARRQLWRTGACHQLAPTGGGDEHPNLVLSPVGAYWWRR